MERLTKRSEDKRSTMVWFVDKEKWGVRYEPCEMDSSQTRKVLYKLAEYEDAEEQGLLLRLPCKVGDKVYADSNCFGVLEYEVDEIIINGDKITFLCSAYSAPIGDCPSECLDEIEPDITDFGKTVFLTKEEAE